MPLIPKSSTKFKLFCSLILFVVFPSKHRYLSQVRDVGVCSWTYPSTSCITWILAWMGTEPGISFKAIEEIHCSFSCALWLAWIKNTVIIFHVIGEKNCVHRICYVYWTILGHFYQYELLTYQSSSWWFGFLLTP